MPASFISIVTAAWTVRKDRRTLVVREYAMASNDPHGPQDEWTEVRVTNRSFSRSYELRDFGLNTSYGLISHDGSATRTPTTLAPGQTVERSWHESTGRTRDGRCGRLLSYARTTQGRMYRGRRYNES